MTRRTDLLDVVACVLGSVGLTAGWEWFGDIRDRAAQAEECQP